MSKPGGPDGAVDAVNEPLLQVQSRLIDRDLVLLGWLADHGVLTTPQIARALYPSLGFAQRRLLKLLDTGVLDRFRPQRPHGGSYPYHYLLAQLGVDVVSAQRGQEELPRRDRARKTRWWLTSRANLPHRLAVNTFFTDLAVHARPTPCIASDTTVFRTEGYPVCHTNVNLASRSYFLVTTGARRGGHHAGHEEQPGCHNDNR